MKNKIKLSIYCWLLMISMTGLSQYHPDYPYLNFSESCSNFKGIKSIRYEGSKLNDSKFILSFDRAGRMTSELDLHSKRKYCYEYEERENQLIVQTTLCNSGAVVKHEIS